MTPTADKSLATPTPDELMKLEHCPGCHAMIPPNKPGENIPCGNCMSAVRMGMGGELGRPQRCCYPNDLVAALKAERDAIFAYFENMGCQCGSTLWDEKEFHDALCPDAVLLKFGKRHLPKPDICYCTEKYHEKKETCPVGGTIREALKSGESK